MVGRSTGGVRGMRRSSASSIQQKMYANHYLRHPPRLASDDPRVEGLRKRADDLERDIALVSGRCFAVIHHGPGHQSATRCTLRGPHGRHRAKVKHEWMYWTDENNSTGFFDEAPEEE